LKYGRKFFSFLGIILAICFAFDPIAVCAVSFGNAPSAIALLGSAADTPVGDIDGDGKAATKDDLVYLERYFAGWSEYQNINLDAADIDGDGEPAKMWDIICLARHINGVSGYEKIPLAQPLKDTRIVVDGVVNYADVYISANSWLISSEDAERIFGVKEDGPRVSLERYAKSADIHYEMDTVLNAAYFHTYKDLYGTVKSEYRIADKYITEKTISVEDPKATEPNPLIETLLSDPSREIPEVTADSHPKWSGMVLYAEDKESYDLLPGYIGDIADWGFNIVRIQFDYRSVFSDDVTSIDAQILTKLDAVVAAAIMNNINLNICSNMIPGHCTVYNFETETEVSEWDLVINPEKQELTDRIWRILSERYENVPSAYLSFTPTTELHNHGDEYTDDDIGKYLSHLIDLITEIDPDRLVIAEMGNNSRLETIQRECNTTYKYVSKDKNVSLTNNFGLGPFINAGMNASGLHIDHQNTGGEIVEYPTVYYGVKQHVYDGSPLTIDGFLPAGTKINVYVGSSWGNGSVSLCADGKELCREVMSDGDYNQTPYMSQYRLYATSDKCLSATLEADADEVKLLPSGLGMLICGIDVILPDEYAVKKTFFYTDYDVREFFADFAGPYKKKTSHIFICPNNGDNGDRVTIKEDVTYVSNSIWEERADAACMDEMAKEFAKISGDWLLRYEHICGTSWESMQLYYTDFYEMCDKYGFGFLSNDWWYLTDAQWRNSRVYECPKGVAYKGYKSFSVELLKLLQKYQGE